VVDREYQYLYLQAFEGGADLRRGLKAWFEFYNSERPHQAHGGGHRIKCTENFSGLKRPLEASTD